MDGSFVQTGDECMKNPKNCDRGLSFSIFEKVYYPRAIIDIHPDGQDWDKKYVFSTGGDYDKTLAKTVPGIALYHKGLDVTAVVSTGTDVWDLTVRGQLLNESWANYGVVWSPPNLDETVNIPYDRRGGLQLYVNLEKVGHVVAPVANDDGTPITWTELPPVTLPKLDPAGNPIPGQIEGPSVMMFGCHYEQMEDGADVTPGFAHFHEASFDEMAIWTRALVKNKSLDETLFFLGGYVKELENLSPEEFADMLSKVDMSDPDQAASAGSMASTLLDNPKPAPAEETTGTGSGPSGGGATGTGGGTAPAASTGTGTGPTGEGLAAALSNGKAVELTWKEKIRISQLKKAGIFKGLLGLQGATEGSLPKHLDSRYASIATAAKMLSCKQDNVENWNIVNEDYNAPSSADYINDLETYALNYIASANISFYDDTKYFTAATGEYIVHIPSDEMFMSMGKMTMERFRMRGQQYDVGAYVYPMDMWTSARNTWENPNDKIVIPTTMFENIPECQDNPITYLYAIYPCYGDFAPLRRNPVTIHSQRFVIDSKVVTVKFFTNNDTFSPTAEDSKLCSDVPVDMKYHPVKVKLYHKSKETTRRKILHHDDEVKTTIERRRCIMWNPDLGLHGAWDAESCTTVMSEQDSTTCECSQFGTYALAAEKIEQPEGKEDYTWLMVVRYIGFSVSLICLTVFILIIACNKHLWEMFHLIRLNTGICYFLALFFHFLSELEVIREDRHNNAAFSSLILFFYLCGSYFQLMEAFAEFRAITGGIIGGKTACYIPLGWGPGFIGLGLTWYLYGTDVGTDPNVFIGWENETKMPFLIMNYFALGVSVVCINFIKNLYLLMKKMYFLLSILYCWGFVVISSSNTPLILIKWALLL